MSKSKVKENEKLEEQTETVSNQEVKSKSKKKIIISTIVIVFVLVLVCIGILAYIYMGYMKDEENRISEIHTTQEESFLEFSEEVKYGQEFSYNDLLAKLVDISKLQENTDIKLKINDTELSKEDKFKFDKLGTYNVKVQLEYVYEYAKINSITKTITNEKTLEIVIEDKEKPVIKGVGNKEITVGDKINLSDGITAKDNVDGNIEIKVEGKVDTAKAGKYNIKVTATDKSGNKEEASFTVNVKEKAKANATTTTTTTQKKNNTNKKSSTSTSKKKTGTSTKNSAASRQSQINTILKMTNKYRAEVGAKALILDSKISAAAQKRATELVKKLSHTRPDGSTCYTVFKEFGIEYAASGENIACVRAGGAAAAKWWRNSPGHYKNMTNPDHSRIGIGAYYYSGKWYCVQLFAYPWSSW